MTQAALLAEQLDDTRSWTLALLADLEGDDWGFQPAPGLAHALWLCGHLASSQNTLIHIRCLGRPALDETFKGHFPLGRPVASTQEYAFPPIASVLDTMKSTHAKTCDAIRGMNDNLLAEPAFGAEGKPHPHYRDKRGAVSHCARHEAFHAGQLATIRRLLGKSFLR